jgi:hypothetical protein
MPKYYFTLLDQEGSNTSEIGYVFENDEAAKAEALRILADMASEGLPCPPMNMISVEVYGEDRNRVIETRLVLDVLSSTLKN